MRFSKSMFMRLSSISLKPIHTIRITATKNPDQGCYSFSISLELTTSFLKKCKLSEKGRILCSKSSLFFCKVDLSLESVFCHGIHGYSLYMIQCQLIEYDTVPAH